MIIETAIAATMYLAEVQIKVVKPLPQEKIDKFKEWEKEDWYKDDKNKDMWDKDWIRK